MEIRSGDVKDLKTLVEFQVRMAQETEDIALDPEVVTRGVEAVFTDRSKGAYWVAEEAGKILGGFLVVPEWSDWRDGTVLWIHSLYVVPEARRRGVFRDLYSHLKEMVERSNELKGLRLYVDRRNRDAQRAYEALGMDAEHYHLYEWMKE